MAIAGQYSVETDSQSIPATMQAAVYRGVNDVRLETVPVPTIGPGEMLTEIRLPVSAVQMIRSSPPSRGRSNVTLVIPGSSCILLTVVSNAAVSTTVVYVRCLLSSVSCSQLTP